METIKVKPWHESQGNHAVINKADFNPKKHELLDDEPAADLAATAAPACPKPGRKPKIVAAE